MEKRRALIVDDSKTAQIRLSKILARFDLAVDTVLSAEEALDYLSYRQPDVIFLDHHMEGMDGLQALKIIKSNPKTAMIAVIMYTSEQGDVYVGQARALGAIDILGKGILKHDNLEKVLTPLGITATDDQASTVSSEHSYLAKNQTDHPPTNLTEKHTVPAAAEQLLQLQNQVQQHHQQLQQQMDYLFDINITKLRQEIEDNTRLLLRRLMKERQQKPSSNLNANDSTTEALEPINKQTIVDSPTTPSTPKIPTLMLMAILLMLILLGYQFYNNNNQLQALNTRLETLATQNNSAAILTQPFSEQKSLSPIQKVEEVLTTNNNPRILLDDLAWAININPEIPFGRVALDDNAINMVGELLAVLTTSQFTGKVFFDVHTGNYCVVADSAGQWVLPTPETNLSDCLFLADQKPVIDDFASAEFLTYIDNVDELTNSTITAEVFSQGYLEPKEPYPTVTTATTAGEWNTAAQKNNRLAISLAFE